MNVEGLVKLAETATDWYEEDEKYRTLSDKAFASIQEHRQLEKVYTKKESADQKRGGLIGGLSGLVGGTAYGRRVGQPKLLGSLGMMAGSGVGAGLANATFEHRNKNELAELNQAEYRKNYDQFGLFHHMDERGYQPD